MKKFGVVVFMLVCAVAGICTWYFMRTPFGEQYKNAVDLCQAGDYSLAQPVLRKAVVTYADTPQLSDAVLWLARCETGINSTNISRWNTVMNVHTGRQAQAEARYHLARNHPNSTLAKQAFVRDFPEREESRTFLLELGTSASNENDTMQAWAAWQKLIDYHPDAPQTQEVIAKLGVLNIKLLCSPRPLPFSLHHEVQRGEILSTIARKHKTFVRSIKRINGLKSDIIRPGTRLKIDKSKYAVNVSIPNHTLTLYRVWDGKTNFVKRYSVGTGKNDNTPRGSFKIDLKQVEPTWYKTGSKPIPYGSKENLLGTRWMGIDCPGFGLHGTWKSESIGSASSAGCIRMHNEEVEELYDIVPLGTTVTIHD
jgi:lipoprotein-anchoring transpeptidase ErfK/SrfK